jgi:hypothetical protein
MPVKERKCVDMPVVPMVGPPPSADFVAIDCMTRVGEAFGLPGRMAFEWAMHLRSAFIDTNVAVAAFEACGRWLQ